MSIAVDFSPADIQLIQAQADEEQMTVSEFIQRVTLKAVRNAEYLAMLDESERQLREGKIVIKSMEELEAMAAE